MKVQIIAKIPNDSEIRLTMISGSFTRFIIVNIPNIIAIISITKNSVLFTLFQMLDRKIVLIAPTTPY